MIDIEWSTETANGRGVRVLTKEGIEFREEHLDPYFYVREAAISEFLRSELEDSNHVTGVTQQSDNRYGKLLKLEVNNPIRCRRLRRHLENDYEIETLEADIPFPRRHMIDTGETPEKPEEALCFDIEVESTDGVPDPDEANERILTIVGIGTDGEQYEWGYNDEKQTIREFVEVAAEYQCVMGYNSLIFDLPYLENRTERIGMHVDFFRFVHIDVLAVYKSVLLISQSGYKLEDVIQKEFPERDWYDFEEIEYHKLGEYFENDRERLIEYNVEDVLAVKKLNEKYRFKDLMFDILVTEGHCRVSDVFYTKEYDNYTKVDKASNTLVEGLLLNESEAVWPNKGNTSGNFEGAKVFEPEQGLHRNVLTLDFSSMYPSIMSALNIGPDTWHKDKSGEIDAPHGSFDKEPQSVFSRAYHRLKARRDETKARRNAASKGTTEYAVAYSLDFGVKAFVNTLYGVMGSGYSRFYNEKVAECVTQTGQSMLEQTEWLADKAGHSVVYGDTDSVLVSLGDIAQDPVEVGQSLAQTLTNGVKRWIEQTYNADSTEIMIDLDDVYHRLYLSDKKKRYAGYCMWDGGPCFTFEMTGFEAVRGDWPKASQNFQVELLQATLDEKPFKAKKKIYDEYKERLFNGELDEQMVERVGLTKPPSEYDTTPPHVRVAKQQGITRANEEIAYLKYGEEPDEVRYVGDGIGNIRRRQYSYLWKKKFKNIAERLGVQESYQQGLDAFA